MKIIISEKHYEKIVEAFQKKSDPIAEHIRNILKKLYSPDNWGKISDPDNNCETNYGVINVYPHLEGSDNWSILNRFDTNTKVRERLQQIFQQEEPNTEMSTKNFMDWLSYNDEKLFKGEYTQELVDINKKTIDKGIENENIAIQILRNFFGENAKIVRFCSGDVRDTKKGMDISVESGGKKFIVQVKPFTKAKSMVDMDGDTFFEVDSYFDPTKYSEKNVQVFLFINSETNKHIAFANKKNKIKKLSGKKIRFDEPFLISNMDFEGQTKVKKYRNKPVEDDLFKMGERRLQNLIFRKSEIEKLIQKEREKLSSIQNQNKNI